MMSKDDIIAFSQSEKIKAGLIWMSHLIAKVLDKDPHNLEPVTGLLKDMMLMIGHEIRLAQSVSPDPYWDSAQKDMEKAISIFSSGLLDESVFHITRALSSVTNVGQRAMTRLIEGGVM